MRVQVLLQFEIPDPPQGTDELYEQAPGGPSWEDAWAAQRVYDGLIQPAVHYHGMEIVNLPHNRLLSKERRSEKIADHDFWMSLLSDPETTLQTNVI